MLSNTPNAADGHAADGRRRRLNIADIAARTGLSTATVSRVINGKPWVATATRERVLAALHEAGYVPSSLAASLRTGRTRLLGLMVGEPRDPTALAAMQGALDAAGPGRYGMVVYMTSDEREHERIYADAIAGGWVDGALVLWPDEDDAPFVRRIYDSGLPLVLIEPTVAMPGIPTVYADAYSDGYTCTQYLLSRGHRRIALCASKPLQGIEARYIDGYRAALDAAGVPYDAALCRSVGFSYEAGYEATRAWLRLPDRPTGMCFHCDMAALGAIAAAREMGVLIPDDLAVIGYDDTQMAGWVKAALTTLRARRRDEARSACELLLALVDGAPAPAEPLVIATDLVIRQSTD